MSTSSELKRCPKCGGPIPAEAPQGLCPTCVLQQACVPTEAGRKGESAKSAPPKHEELAAAFPQLEILELIGEGGMGFVFKARQPKIERLVALKILPSSLAADPAFAERFTREGRMLARLNHPNIVTLHDFGQAGGFFYLLMEFVDGVNLRQAMKVGRFTPAQALAIVPKICEALQFAHNEGILHRDIKPENILLDSKGRVKIADFGIAKLLEAGDSPLGQPELTGSAHPANLTETGKVLGTPQYMAPEQIEHPQDVDQRADIYSLGVVFYEMLTGELPIGRFAPPSEKSAVDARVDEVVLRTLEKERERRQQSAGEVKTQVETITGASPGAPARTALPSRTRTFFGPRIAVGAILAFAAILGMIGLLSKSPGTPSRVGEQKEPYFLQGMSLILATNYTGAIESFEKALEVNPKSAAAHFELGLLFDQKVTDAPAAIYHYEQYLRLYPKAENADIVKQRVLDCRKALAEAVSNRSRVIFGPVVERELASRMAIDFDTSKVALLDDVKREGVPGGYFPFGPMREQGLDAWCVDPTQLAPAEMRLKRLAKESWDKTTPEQLVQEVQSISAYDPPPSFMSVPTNGPTTYGFQTRESAVGLLQILGFTENPRGVKIRYKLVRGAPMPPTAPAELPGQLPPAGGSSGTVPSLAPPAVEGKFIMDTYRSGRAQDEPDELVWKCFVPPGSLASILFVRWTNGVPQVVPGFSAYFKVGKGGGIDIPFCMLLCHRLVESKGWRDMNEDQRHQALARMGYPESAGVTNAFYWSANLGSGWVDGCWTNMPPYHGLKPPLPQSLRSSHQLVIGLLDFDTPESNASHGQSGVELRIFLAPLKSPPIRMVPNEVDHTNYIAGTGLAGTMEEALRAIKEWPTDP